MICNEPGCKAQGTERRMSAFYCRQHLPVTLDGNCSHSLNPSGQCAYCGWWVREMIEPEAS